MLVILPIGFLMIPSTIPLDLASSANRQTRCTLNTTRRNTADQSLFLELSHHRNHFRLHTIYLSNHTLAHIPYSLDMAILVRLLPLLQFWDDLFDSWV